MCCFIGKNIHHNWCGKVLIGTNRYFIQRLLLQYDQYDDESIKLKLKLQDNNNNNSREIDKEKFKASQS